MEQLNYGLDRDGMPLVFAALLNLVDSDLLVRRHSCCRLDAVDLNVVKSSSMERNHLSLIVP